MPEMTAYLLDWANLLVRWLHLIAGIAWIGASFYFVMLDTSLKRPKKAADEDRGVFGELWAVHGGGFYCSQKFLTGPRGEALSEDLHWSKWEAYTTWLSGMGLLAIVYWLGAPGTLLDAGRYGNSGWLPALVSLGFIGAGWLIYDQLCRHLAGHDKRLITLVALLALAADGLAHYLFSARGAFIQVGAMLGTCMAANVFFHIIPGQKRMVAALRAGQPVDPRPGIVGKQRSVHNTYFTLPVLFVMISNHYPMTFGHAQAPWVLAALMFAGVLIRQYFVLRHRHAARLWLPLSAVAILIMLIVAMAPRASASGPAVDLATAQRIVALRCIACHAEHPTQPGFAQAPKGIVLSDPAQMLAVAGSIHVTLASGYMPLGNLTGMTDDERQQLLAWSRQAVRSPN